MSRYVAAGRKARNEANRGAGTGGVAERPGMSRFVAGARKAPNEPKWAHAAAAGGAGVADRGGDGVGGRGSAGRRAADGGALEKAPPLRRRGRPVVRGYARTATGDRAAAARPRDAGHAAIEDPPQERGAVRGAGSDAAEEVDLDGRGIPDVR